MQKRAIIINERGRSACNDFSCDYFRCIFAKEKEFYSANEAYVLTNVACSKRSDSGERCGVKKAMKSRNLLILSMQQRNNIQCHNWDKRKTMWVYPRPQFWFKDLAEEIDNAVGSVGL